MAYIYVITNQINGKQYVGKTLLTIQDRWKTHVYDSTKLNTQNRPLYKAFHKYGVDNFQIEELEECSAEESSNKEMFWIKKLDTYHNGYNATLGGDSKHYYNYSEIAAKYLELQNIKETAEFFNCDSSTIKTACKDQNVTILSSAEQNKRLYSKQVDMYDLQNHFICTFNSLVQAYQYLFDHGYTKVSTPKGVTSHLSAVCKGKRKTAYQHIWKYHI